MGVGRGRGGRVRPRKKSALVYAGVLLALIVFPALSGATPSSPPSPVTGAATAVTKTSATLNGTVDTNDPDGVEQANYFFSYWTTNPADTTETTVTPVAAGLGAHSVSAGISGLSQLTTYHFKLCATNTFQSDPPTCDSTSQSFTTPGDSPGVTTGAASAVTPDGRNPCRHGRSERRSRHLEVLLRYRPQHRHELPELLDRWHDRLGHESRSRCRTRSAGSPPTRRTSTGSAPRTRPERPVAASSSSPPRMRPRRSREPRPTSASTARP